MLGNEAIVVIVFMVILLVAMFIPFVFMLLLLRPWLQAFAAGAHVSIFDIIGMKLRRINVQTVVNSLIMARQSGVEVSSRELQSAYLRGVDLEKLTLAHIESQKRELGLKFEELVELELKDRLAEKLKE